MRLEPFGEFAHSCRWHSHAMQCVELEEITLELTLGHLVVHPLELQVVLHLGLELCLLECQDDHASKGSLA